MYDTYIIDTSYKPLSSLSATLSTWLTQFLPFLDSSPDLLCWIDERTHENRPVIGLIHEEIFRKIFRRYAYLGFPFKPRGRNVVKVKD